MKDKIATIIDTYLDALADAQADLNDAYGQDSKSYFAAIERHNKLCEAVFNAIQALEIASVVRK